MIMWIRLAIYVVQANNAGKAWNEVKASNVGKSAI